MDTTGARQRWARLIPIIFIVYSLAYVDRANFGFGAAAGLAKTLHITAGATALLSSLFFLGYFFFQIPGAHYAEKRSAKRIVFWGMILWGVLASLTGVLTNVGMLMVDRLLLGVVESVLFPSLLVFNIHWFLKPERARANTFLILGNPVTVLWMSVVSGFLIAAIGWQWMFILEGIPSIVMAFIWWGLIKDHPSDATWLDARQQESFSRELAAEQQEFREKPNYWKALRSRDVVLLAGQYFFWSIGVYGFVLWLPSIVKAASGLGIGETGLISAIPYLLAIVLMVVASYLSDKRLNRKIFVWPSLLLAGIALYASFSIGVQQFVPAMILLVIAGGLMYAPYGPFFAIIPDIVPRSASGESMAMINSMGALGSFVGSYFVGYLGASTGGPTDGFLFMSLSLVISAILTALVRTKGHRQAAKQPGQVV
ncbi:MFS transporter [Sulfobacillus harzensis]|uniref:MFS transporter n=1 Tax=Sulfobacillus harzensis TaxID=2729629 RepID=A0A7Y0L180_9FIRM|nr:MFS transporter [Sulfobacillus harzensis]NMP21402.1 MFS transporter [Sulfobacillus harzensis]